MKVEQLVGWLSANGWKYRLHRGSIDITHPHGIEAEYSFSVVENATLDSILLPPCSFERGRRGSRAQQVNS